MKISLSKYFLQTAAWLCAAFLAFPGHAEDPVPAKLDPPVTPSLSGRFLGNGKEAALKYVLVEEREPFSDEEAITLIFTEKDPVKAKKPSFDAMFGKLGSALILNVQRAGGDIFGCQVVHSAHGKQGFSSVGQIRMQEFSTAGGNVKGAVTTGGTQDAFGEKWEVDLKFAAPLPEKLRNAPAAKAKPTPAGTDDAPEEKEAKAPSGPLISARKLPLPGDAAGVEYKEVVEQIEFTSVRPVDAVAKEFSAKLKQQGWKDGPGNLMGKNNAILKREKGDARLTIMVQPAPKGCVVKIFTEGMDWNGGDGDDKPSATTKPADADDIENQANKLIKDALKNLPNGM